MRLHHLRSPRIVPWLVVLAVGSTIGLLAWWVRGFPADDAYIHLRIAENLWLHGSPSYHAGDGVMGSSSPAWTLVLAALMALPTPLTTSVPLFEVAVLAASAAQAAVLVRRHAAANVAGQVVAAVLVTALVYRSALAWMETPLAILLWLHAVDGWLCGRTRWGSLVGVAAAIRLEFVLVGGLMALADLVRRRWAAIPGCWAILAGGLPFVVYDLVFFGTVVPAPMPAKSVVYQLSFAESVATALPLYQPTAAWLWGLAVAGVVVVLLRQSGLTYRAIPLVAGLLVLAAYVGRSALVFRWYHPLFAVPVVVGALVLGRARPKLAWASAGLMALPYLKGLADDVLAGIQNRPQDYHGYVSGLRVQKYLEIGARVRAEAPDAVLLTPEIGALGHAFGGRVIDAVGLVSPEVLPHHPLDVPTQRRSGGLGAIPASLVEETRPDVVVTLTSLGEDFLGAPVREHYTCHVESPVPEGAPSVEVYGSRWLHVCWRKRGSHERLLADSVRADGASDAEAEVDAQLW